MSKKYKYKLIKVEVPAPRSIFIAKLVEKFETKKAKDKRIKKLQTENIRLSIQASNNLETVVSNNAEKVELVQTVLQQKEEIALLKAKLKKAGVKV